MEPEVSSVAGVRVSRALRQEKARRDGASCAMSWSPQRYETFADQRLRPALDLLQRVPLEAPRRVLDLGCGSGNVTLQLTARWPSAEIIGIDSSEEMLSAARSRSTAVQWVRADIDDWKPQGRCDLVFSNAALHWVDGHETLLPRFMGWLERGGALAIQMPRNFEAPSHVVAYELAAEHPFREHLKAPSGERRLTSEQYAALLASQASSLDVWETEYLHLLEGDNPVADWTRATLLIPLLDQLAAPLRAAFEQAYRQRVLRAYPKSLNGKTVFRFKRLFVVAIAA
jgi:trans-aconitate 2-methyltransferase